MFVFGFFSFVDHINSSSCRLSAVAAQSMWTRMAGCAAVSLHQAPSAACIVPPLLRSLHHSHPLLGSSASSSVASPAAAARLVLFEQLAAESRRTLHHPLASSAGSAPSAALLSTANTAAGSAARTISLTFPDSTELVDVVIRPAEAASATAAPPPPPLTARTLVQAARSKGEGANTARPAVAIVDGKLWAWPSSPLSSLSFSSFPPFQSFTSSARRFICRFCA